MPLKVTAEEKSKGVYTITPEGSIDANTYRTLQAEVDSVLEKSPLLIIFDMKDVSYVNSAGIGVFMIAEKSMNLNEKTVLMVRMQPQIRKVFDIVQALPAEQIFASVEEMDRYLTEIQRKVKGGEIQ